MNEPFDNASDPAPEASTQRLDDTSAEPDEASAGVDEPDEARSERADRPRRPARDYAARVALHSVIAGLVWLGVMLLIGIPPTVGSGLNIISICLFAGARTTRDLQRAQWCLTVFAGAIVPFAVLTNALDLWLACIWSAGFAAAAAAMRLYRQRLDRKPRRAWATLASGQEVPLVVLPSLCPVCDRTHHFVFAEHAPIPEPANKPLPVHFETPKRAPTEFMLYIKPDEEGRLHLMTMPDDFSQRQWAGEFVHGDLEDVVDGDTARPGVNQAER